MSIQKQIKQNKWLFKQFAIINRTAKSVYSALQGDVGMNFYACHCEYEDGVLGWIKEASSFQTAVEIYEQFTCNDGWDILGQLDDLFGDELKEISYETILQYEDELIDID